ncbi:uncharacterized protein LOC134705584 [Mytilus trossulus]|uniref:uncharacterized protein LOC134705584 n=1 Tax=Mytilus trossulus TaxID=6551 RepID=UPI0030042057
MKSSRQKRYISLICSLFSVLGFVCHAVGFASPFWYHDHYSSKYGAENYFHGIWKACFAVPGLPIKCHYHDSSELPLIHDIQAVSAAGLLAYGLAVFLLNWRTQCLEKFKRSCVQFIGAGVLLVAGLLCLVGLMMWMFQMPVFFILHFGLSIRLEVVSIVLAVVASSLIIRENITHAKTECKYWLYPNPNNVSRYIPPISV